MSESKKEAFVHYLQENEVLARLHAQFLQLYLQKEQDPLDLIKKGLSREDAVDLFKLSKDYEQVQKDNQLLNEAIQQKKERITELRKTL